MAMSFVLASVNPKRMQTFTEEMKKHRYVKEAHHVYGDYDIILKTETKTLDEMDVFMKYLREHVDINEINVLLHEDSYTL
ncbi:MAG: Lrp/AsnC ligand binding domain-containing protein [archaeon]